MKLLSWFAKFLLTLKIDKNRVFFFKKKKKINLCLFIYNEKKRKSLKQLQFIYIKFKFFNFSKQPLISIVGKPLAIKNPSKTLPLSAPSLSLQLERENTYPHPLSWRLRRWRRTTGPHRRCSSSTQAAPSPSLPTAPSLSAPATMPSKWWTPPMLQSGLSSKVTHRPSLLSLSVPMTDCFSPRAIAGRLGFGSFHRSSVFALGR